MSFVEVTGFRVWGTPPEAIPFEERVADLVDSDAELDLGTQLIEGEIGPLCGEGIDDGRARGVVGLA